MNFTKSLLSTAKLLAIQFDRSSPWPLFDQRPDADSAMSRRHAGVGAARRIIDDPELPTRTSWVDSEIAYRQVSKGRAYGNKRALWLRRHLQTHLYKLGCFTDKHCGKVLFLGLLLLSLCCVGLKTATMETNVERLWVEEDGRLQKELKYTKNLLGEGSGTTFELLIQTPKMGHNNLLSVESMLHHYEALKAVTRITVDMYGITWTFKDLCYATSFPSFENSMFDRILDSIVPCVIITPLDCFWEASKLLGPSHGIFVPGYHPSVKWTNLNPMELVRSLKRLGSFFPADTVMDALTRAGVGAAYQDRPCLNPNDMECPSLAPNRASKVLPDIGAELTGGCSGFATKYMHWKEQLIIGGIHKNKTGHIVRAEALQSIVQLLGEKEMYDFHKETYKVHGVDWTAKKAKRVLEEWQRKFTKVVLLAMNESAEGHTIHPFSSTTLLDILAEFSKIDVFRIGVGYGLMLIYACFSLWRWSNAVKSQSGVAMAGVILVSLSVAAGLGLCSVIGIKFNASSTQIIPFLALGLGVNDMFFIIHIFSNLHADAWTPSEQIGECLKRTGISMLLTSVCFCCAFFMAAIIPIPALRAFVLQAGILVIFNVTTIFLVFPAVLSIDLIRKRQNRVDIFCCFKGTSTDHVVDVKEQQQQHHQRQQQQQQRQQQQQQQQSQRQETPPPEYCEAEPPSYSNVLFHASVTRTESDGTRPKTELTSHSYAPSHGFRNNAVAPAPPGAIPPTGSLPPSTSNSRQCLTPGEQGGMLFSDCSHFRADCSSWSLTWLAKHVYAPLLEKTPIKVLVIVCGLVILVISIVGVTKVKDGLDLTDVVPKATNEYRFLEAQSKYFGFYTFNAVTKDNFDYANGQSLLYAYHNAFQHISKIIKKDDGSLPDFWLKLFRDWLKYIEDAFRRDIATNCITRDGWYANATDDGILGYKLMVQTGDIDDPINKDRVFHGHLVGSDGIIYVNAFYTYLSAWASNDALAYAASQANFHPKPREWIHVAVDKDLKIEKSQPLAYAQLPFYLLDMTDTDDITSTIKTVRSICDRFTQQGLPNYPSGIPFTFWEQYLNLRYYLMMSLLCILAVIFVVLSVVLVNIWAPTIMVAVLAINVVELFGFMGLVGIKLSAVPAVLLVVSVGIGVDFTVHLCLGFLTSIGSRNKRMCMALEHVLAPVINGAMSTFLGVVMLAVAEFDFIVKYFFVVLSMLIVIGTLNGLVLLPVLLSIFGPPSEVVPLDKSDRLPPPTPEPSPPPHSRRSRGLSRHHGYPRVPSDISLTTITEESSQYSSHGIVVQPHVVVETSVPDAVVTVDDGSQRNMSGRRGLTSISQTRHVATVRTTTKVKVELHTTLPGAVEQEHSYYKSRRRKDMSYDSDSECSSSSV